MQNSIHNLNEIKRGTNAERLRVVGPVTLTHQNKKGHSNKRVPVRHFNFTIKNDIL